MKVWGEWWGGYNYAPPSMEDREPFASIAEAKRVFACRANGWDPVQNTRTPLVENSEMYLYLAEDGTYADIYLFEGPRGGIRVARA